MQYRSGCLFLLERHQRFDMPYSSDISTKVSQMRAAQVATLMLHEVNMFSLLPAYVHTNSDILQFRPHYSPKDSRIRSDVVSKAATHV